MQHQNYNFPESYQSLEVLQRRVPVVSDKALIDLVNGIQVSQDVIRYRQNSGFLKKIFEQLTGNDSKRQLLLDGNLIAGQETLYQWILELSDSLRISQVGLQVTHQSLVEARKAICSVKHKQEKIEDLIESIVSRLDQKLSTRLDANEDFEDIIAAWTGGETYTNLPWAIQVTLLAKEVFSSSVLTYERKTGDTSRFRSLLRNKIITHSPELPKKNFSIADLLDHSWREMEQSDLSLSAALLEVRSIPLQRLLNSPLLFTMGETLELADLPEQGRPSNPGRTAIERCRAQISPIFFRVTDARGFVTKVIEETANDCLAIISRS